MGMYNMLFGVNPLFPVLLKSLNLSYHGDKIQIDGEYSPGRFRDIYLSEDGTKVILFTRNGGGNRECWDDWKWGESGCEECEKDYECLPEKIAKLQTHPLYVRDYDDAFDCTYAYFEFKVPKALDPILDKIMKEQGGPPQNIAEKFNEVLKEMKEMPKEEFEKDPRFAPLFRIFEDMFAEDPTE